jgi:hypothetical protein
MKTAAASEDKQTNHFDHVVANGDTKHGAAISTLLVIPAFVQMDPNSSMHQQHVEDTARPVATEKSPYTDRSVLPVKALTQDAMDGYRNGTGIGLAIPAEMNGYPGPRHVLDLADELELTATARLSMSSPFSRPSSVSSRNC